MRTGLEVLVIVSCIIALTSGNIFEPSGDKCDGVDVKFDLNEFKKLEGCGIVQGSVQISQLNSLSNVSFPYLREIIGRLVLYKVSKIRSLSQLFPNLVRIHGEDLLENYAMILVDNPDLEEIGLSTLQQIKNGAVRIEGNDKLCFLNVNWTSLVSKDFVSSNYFKNAQLDICPKNQDQPQLGSSCDYGGVCCEDDCLSCRNDNPKICTVCRRNIVEIPNKRCVDVCPYRTYEFMGYRCITKEECKNLNINSTSMLPFIPSKGRCLEGCQDGYQIKYAVEGNKMSASCSPCKGKDCWKRCEAAVIDSIEEAQKLKGCQWITNSLEIKLNPTSNLIEELEESMSDIIEIENYLKVSFTPCISSLRFLKNLKYIRGKTLVDDKYSVFLFDNANIRKLLNEGQEIRIKTGKVSVHFNPKLCFSEIEKFANSSDLLDDFEATKKSNENKDFCDLPLEITSQVTDVETNSVSVHWKVVKLDNISSIFNYVIFLKETETQKVEFQGECGSDWKTIAVNNLSEESKSQKIQQLQSYTQYAFYVKAYILPSKFEVTSDINFFTTLPGIPEKVEGFRVTTKDSSSFQMAWDPPKKTNGPLDKFELTIRKVDTLNNFLRKRDFCVEPFNSTDAATPENSTIPSSEVSDALIEPVDFEGKLLSSLNSKKLSRSKRESRYHIDEHLNEFTFDKLDHFSTYSVSIRACRKEIDVEDEFCGSKVELIAKTEKKVDADVIERMVAVHSNKTANDVKITWTPPEDPNGAVLNYVVKQTRVDDPQVTELICISLLNRENLTSQVIEKIKPGNFSFQIAAVTLVGQSEFTSPMYVYIEPPSFFSLIVSPSFLMLLAMIIVSAIAMLTYNFYKRNSTSEILSSFDHFDYENEFVRQ